MLNTSLVFTPYEIFSRATSTSGATYLVITVCISTYVRLIACLWPLAKFWKFCQISKIPKAKCVSGHSEQLQCFDPRPPPTITTQNEVTLDLAWCKLGPQKNFCSNFFFNFFFLTKSVPTRTKSRPNSKLFEPECMIGDATLLVATYRISWDFKTSKTKMCFRSFWATLIFWPQNLCPHPHPHYYHHHWKWDNTRFALT